MNDEIKEILDKIKKCIETNDNIESFIIDIIKWKELLDYITNLQQENERIEKEWFDKTKQLGELSSRIYRAIEYINKDRTSDTIRFPLIIYKKDLLNILQNGSDSE